MENYKERPINLYDDEVHDAVAGQLTQVRRLIAPQPEIKYVGGWGLCWYRHPDCFTEMSQEKPSLSNLAVFIARLLAHCPYGKPGDRLWVREAWKQIGEQVWYRFCQDETRVAGTRLIPISNWRSATHMPRALSRITLEVVSTHVEYDSYGTTWAWVIGVAVI